MVIEDDIRICHIRAVPLHKQIARYFRKKLLDGAFRTGDTFPGSRQIAKATGVHYNTVLKAYRLLRAEGVIRMYERRQAWFERYELQWMQEARHDLSAYEIRAALRSVLVLGVAIDSVGKWVANLVENEVLKPARDNPELKLKALLAKAMHKRNP